MKIFKFNLKYFFFILFFINSTAVYSSSLQFKGLSKLTIDDLQSLTSVDIYKKNITDIDLDQIIKDLYISDLIYDLDFSFDSGRILISIVENSLIEEIYINGNIRIKDSQIKQVLQSKVNFYINKNDLNEDISNIRILLNSLGYIDNSVKVKKEKYSDNRINLVFEISEGPRYKITDVKFFGNSTFSDKYLYSKINTKTLSSYNIVKSGSNFATELFEFDLSALNIFYQQKGFFDIKIKYELKRKRTADFQLIYYVDEGERYLIDEIIYDYPSFTNSKNELNKLTSKFDQKIKKNDYFFDYTYVKDHIISINKSLKTKGLYEIEAAHTFDRIDEKNILKFYELQLEKKYISKIEIIGNSITKDKTLRSKIEVEPGDLYSNFRIKNDVDALKNLKYIKDTKADTLSTNDLVDLTYQITENKKSGEFMIGGSYSADVGVGLALNLKDTNFQGSGDEVEFTFNGNTEKLYTLYTTIPIIN